MNPKKIENKQIDSECVNQFIRDLRSVKYHNAMIRNYNLQLEDIENQLQGIQSPTMKKVMYENAKDPYSSDRKHELMCEEELLLCKRQKHIDRIKECERIELIKDSDDKQMVIDLYVLGMKYDDLTKTYKISRSTLFDNVKKTIYKIM